MCRLLNLVRGSAVLLLIAAAALAQQPFGPLEPPKPGQILPAFQQQMLKLTAEQKKELAELQKDVDAKLGKLLTAEQTKLLKEPRGGPGGFGPAKGAFGGPGGFPGGFGGPGGFPGGFATVRLDDVKKAIASTDEEWKVIGPKLQKVLAARQVLASEPRSADGKSAGTPGPGGVPARGGNEVNVITQAHTDFKAVLDNPKHTKSELQEAADAVRKARDKARTDLVAAQKDLRPLLTQDQETILLGLGYLD